MFDNKKVYSKIDKNFVPILLKQYSLVCCNKLTMLYLSKWKNGNYITS